MRALCAIAVDATIRAHLAAFERHAADDGALRRAAVAVTVLDCDSAPRVLVAKRVPRGLNAGQWALPGGKLEPGEDAVAGALRELREETGLDLPPAAGRRAARRLRDRLGLLHHARSSCSPRRRAARAATPAELASLHPIAAREPARRPRPALGARRRTAARCCRCRCATTWSSTRRRARSCSSSARSRCAAAAAGRRPGAAGLDARADGRASGRRPAPSNACPPSSERTMTAPGSAT